MNAKYIIKLKSLIFFVSIFCYANAYPQLYSTNKTPTIQDIVIGGNFSHWKQYFKFIEHDYKSNSDAYIFANAISMPFASRVLDGINVVVKFDKIVQVYYLLIPNTFDKNDISGDLIVNVEKTIIKNFDLEFFNLAKKNEMYTAVIHSREDFIMVALKRDNGIYTQNKDRIVLFMGLRQ